MFNYITRDVERELFPCLKRLKVGVACCVGSCFEVCVPANIRSVLLVFQISFYAFNPIAAG
jgi:hypothetical protein